LSFLKVQKNIGICEFEMATKQVLTKVDDVNY